MRAHVSSAAVVEVCASELLLKQGCPDASLRRPRQVVGVRVLRRTGLSAKVSSKA